MAYPRRCVFVGTINREGEYLKGQTGNTRFLPVACTKEWQPPDEATTRLQLFAEAKHVYKALTVPWWTVAKDIETCWMEEREERREGSLYEEAGEQVAGDTPGTVRCDTE